jgi:glycosyltransferase involved in cell wall biosynthesis
MARPPSVSVVISFLNAQDFLQEAVESVLGQTLEDWELLLVDDGSTDSSSSLAQTYVRQNAGRMRYIEHAGHRNMGLPASRNVGIREARGKYVALLDADDIWFPGKLTEQVAIMKAHPEVVMTWGCTLYWHQAGARCTGLARDFVQQPGVELNRVYLPPQLLVRSLSIHGLSSPCPSDLLFQRADILELGGFEEAFTSRYATYEDQAFLSKVHLKAPVFVSGSCWDRYRVHSQSMCAMVAAQGRAHESGRFYLEWLSEYLLKEGITDRDIWHHLRMSLWYYRHPLMHRVAEQANFLASALARYFRVPQRRHAEVDRFANLSTLGS